MSASRRPGPPAPRGRRAARSARAGRAALGLVLLALVALVVVPVINQQRVNELRREIEAAEPARTLATQLQFNLAREMASLSEILLSGDSAYAVRFTRSRATEERIVRRLQPLAAALGPEVQRRLEQAVHDADLWHARVSGNDILAQSRAPEAGEGAVRETGLFEQALASARAVDSAIVIVAAENRARVDAVQRQGLRTTLVLGVLALIAAGAAATLDARVRAFADESERRRGELERALEQTARANDARTRLLRGITHDVKNPLGAAKGYAELLEMGTQGPVPPEQLPFIAGIKRSVDGALAIITDLLDVARADAGGLTVTPVHVDLAAVVSQIAETHRAAAVAAGHALECDAPPGGLALATDPARVSQVLGNLITNAIKYTPSPGTIRMRTLAVEGDRAPRPGRWAAVEVTDSGPGVPAELRESIFDEFTRVDDRAMHGHGLGLAIARRVARLLGGDVTVGDGATGGAQFTLWLPADGRTTGR